MKRTNPRSISRYFVEYPKRAKGYKFYCPSRSAEIVELVNANFKNGDNCGRYKIVDILFD